MTMTVGQVAAKLAAHGHRATQARRDVIAALLRSERHVSADELYALLQDEGSSVGRMTVFRTLDLLSAIGVVRPVYQGSGAAHFVVLEDGHHHHLVCTECARTIEFEDCTVADALSRRLAAEHDFEIAGHLLEIYGRCAACRA